MRVSRSSLLMGSLLLALNLGGCAPVVNQQVGHAASSVVAPAPAPQPAAPVRPAAESTRRVGLLLPLSGAQAALGQNLLDAAQLATFDIASADFALIPVDTTGTPEGAAAAARQALQDGATLLIGPVFSGEVNAVKAVAMPAQVPVLTLSNNANLADNRTFVLGFTPSDQVVRVLSYAQKNNISRIAALIPVNPYGDRVVETLQTVAPQLGLAVVRVERYQPNANPAATATAFAAALTQGGGADALFLADGGQQLAGLLPMLAQSGLDFTKTRLLGTALWDDPSAQRIPQLAGAWYATPSTEARRLFADRYTRTYGTAPAPIAALAYDATAMAAVLAKQGNGQFDLSRLTDPNGFSGATGIFRLAPTGLVEHGLEVRELGTGEVHRRDAAPSRFSTLIN